MKTKNTKNFLRSKVAALASLLLLLCVVQTAEAATGVNKEINFQGKVVNTDGTNVTTGSYTFLFCIYTTATPATACTSGANNDAVWREEKSITVTDGIFQTSLGDTTAFASLIDFNTDNIYLGINFNANGQMTPLVHFTSAPYAMNADKVGGLGTADLIVKTATANQTVTSSQTLGTVFGVTDTTGISAAIKGLNITLSGTGAFDQTGLEFSLSGASGTNLNDIVGSGSTWKVSTGGAATFASVGAGSGTITTSGTIGTASTTTFTGAGATFSSAVAANGGITFDQATDQLGAHTLGGTLDANVNIITNIGNTGTDFIASTGALTLAGILTANGGISLTGGQSLTAGALSYVDLGLIVHNSTTPQGLRLPQAASATPSNPTSGEGYLAWDAAGNQLITYNGTSWATVGGGSIALNDLTDVVTSTPAVDQILRYNGTNWVNGSIGNTSAGSGVSFFYSNSASGISTYETVSQTPDPGAEQDETIVVNNNTQAFENYSTTAALGRTSIDAGVWNFNTYAYVSATTGTTTLTFNVYKRASGGAETLLFSVATPDINNTSAGLITASSVQPAYAILATDLLVVKLNATTDNVGNITAHFVHSGTSHYSNIETPLVTSHNNLAGLQGGTSNEFYHLTSTEYTGSGTGTFARVSSPIFTTPNIGSATGSVSGSSATVTGAAQTLITSVGTLTGLTMGGILDMNANIITNIGNVGTDFIASTGALTLAGILTANGGISIGANALTGTTGIIDYTNFDVDATGNITVAASKGLDTKAAGVLQLGKTNATSVDICNSANCDTINIGNLATTDADTIIIGDVLDTTSINSTGWSVTGAGALTVASTSAGSGTITTSGTIGTASTTTFTGAGATFSSAIAANGGITFDAGTDTIGSFTAGGTISMGTQALNGTTGIINYTGFDVDASGNLDALGTITAGSGNIAVTDANGKVQHDSIVDCLNTEILKWATAGGWACAADATGGGGGTLQGAYDTASGNTILTTTARNIAFTLGEVATPTSFTIENQDTAGVSAERIFNSIVSGTLTNGLLFEQTGAGAATNAIQVLSTAGTIINGLLIADGAGAITNGIQMTGTFTTTILDTPSIDISGTGAITGATGVSTTTVTASSAIAANGGITFDAGTDTIGAFTAGGTISMGSQALNGTTGVINYTNFDVDASGNLDALGTITAGSGNVAVTDAAGKVQHDSIVDCADGQILKWATAGGWACAADATGGGGGGATTKYLTANHAISTIAATEVTSLTTTLAAGTYVFQYYIIDTTATGTVSPMYAVNFTGTAAKRKMTLRYPSTGTTAITGLADDIGATSGQIMEAVTVTAFATTPPNMGHTGGQTVTNNVYKVIEGIMVVTASGNLALWHGSETATLTTLLSGSSLVITQISAGADLAEIYGTMDPTIEAGDVVSLDSSMKSGVKKSNKPYDSDAFGIIATSPSIVMGNVEDAGATPAIVALAGRVPVKVSTENGAISAGNLLTPSSTPGVAMKATKAGQIIGQAMMGFDEEGIGQTLVFIKTDYANGSKIADLLPGVSQDTEASQEDIGKRALTYFIEQKGSVMKAVDISEITTDRLSAGLEIITPKITAQELNVDIIKPSFANVLSVQFGADGAVTFGEPGKDPTSRIDALGNATFSGIVTAKTIRAETIEGLEIYTDSVKSLEDKYANLNTFVNQETAIDSASENSVVMAASTDSVLKNLTTNTLTVNLDASILGKLTVTGGLSISDDAEFKGETLFKKLATFFGDTIFKGKVLFENTPIFSSNTAGFAVIEAGQKSVEVTFDESYTKQPIVSVSLTADQSPLFEGADEDLRKDIGELEKEFAADYFDRDMKYIVVKNSEKGFTILLNKKTSSELKFSWVALAVKDSKTSYSKKSSENVTTDKVSEIPDEEAETASSVEVVPAETTETINEEVIEGTLSDTVEASPAVEEIEPMLEEVTSDDAPIVDELSLLTDSLGQ